MSAQLSPHRKRHRTGDGRRGDSTSFGNPAPAPGSWTFERVQLHAVVAVLLSVALVWGGRTPLGQMLLAAGSAGVFGVWLGGVWRQARPVWIPIPGIALGLAGGLIMLLQIAPLPPAWLATLSPAQAGALPLWSSDSAGLLGLSSWDCISLSPHETRSALAVYAACLLVFAMSLQGMRTTEDALGLLRLLATVALGMAVFGVAQFVASNDKFFWIIEQPQLSTRHYATGSFLNRNHFAQFVVLGIGPATAWLVMLLRRRQTSREQTPRTTFQVVALGVTLSIAFVAVLLSLSRAGTVSMLIATGAAGVALSRCGWIVPRSATVLAIVAVAVGGTFCFSSSAALSNRFALLDTNGRYTIWTVNLALVQKFPWLGTGSGTHIDAHYLELEPRTDDKEFVHAESSLLEVASETGLAGVLVGAGMLLTCLWWCGVVMVRGSPTARAAACGVFASLLASTAHAGVDFVWHTPACLLFLVLLAAVACRLYTLTVLPLRDRPSERPLSRGFVLAASPLVLVAGWAMIQQLLPSAQAEAAWREYLTLTFYRPVDDDQPTGQDADDLWKQRLRLAHRAARLDRRHARAQETAATFYLRLFDLKQAAAGRPQTFALLRNAVEGSEFESADEVRRWVAERTGSNLKLLDLAWQTALRAVRTAPLRGEAFLTLAQLAFLHDPSGQLKFDLLEQAQAARPNDGRIRFFLGQEALLAGDLPAALEHWRIAFRTGEDRQRKIAVLLAGQFPAQFFLEEFQPDEPGLRILAEIFAEKERPAERLQVLEVAAARAEEQARTADAVRAERHWSDAVEARRQLEDRARFEATLREGVQHCPQNFHFRRQLGELLLERGEFAGAAEELQWCAARRPDDQAVRALAARALKESYRRPAGDVRRSIRLTSETTGESGL